MIVSVFVSCIALGSLAVAALPRIGRGRAGRGAVARRARGSRRSTSRSRPGPTGCTCCARCFATRTRSSRPTTPRRSRVLLLADRARGGALGRGAAAALPRAAPRGRRARRAGRSPVQHEHARLARGRADRRLCAVLLARPAPGVPRGGVRARARGGGRDAARGAARRAARRGSGAASRALLLVGSFRALAGRLPGLGGVSQPAARGLDLSGTLGDARSTAGRRRCSTTTIRTARSRCCRCRCAGRTRAASS